MVNLSINISVIVPVYNAEKYLHRCIDSILAQKFTNFELLLIDDGSTDNSGKICDEYKKKDPRIRVFHKINGGSSSARNLGLENAAGEWVTFCDADDWVDVNWLEVFLNCPESDLIIQGFYIHKGNNFTTKEYVVTNRSVIFKRIEYKECLLELDLKKNIGFLWCRLFKKQIIDEYKIRFNENFALCEDLDFIFRYMSKTQKVYVRNSACYHYNMPDYSSKYKKGQHDETSTMCFYGILHYYFILAGSEPTDLLYKLINQYTNSLIHLCRNSKVNYKQIKKYLYFDKKIIKKVSSKQKLSIRTRIFHLINCISNTRFSYTINVLIWKIIRKYS